MSNANAAVMVEDDDDLFAQIGVFIAAQGLSLDPVDYAFAHTILTRDDAEARMLLARLFDDGVRLSRHEIEAMGGSVKRTGADKAIREANAQQKVTDRLVTETRARAEAIVAMMRALRDDTRGFGHDLAQQVAQYDADGADGGDIAGLARAMIARVATAEARLVQATEETDMLRAELAEAQTSARRDPLTGLSNRLALAEAFAALPAEGSHCLALCDIDRFKLINDRFGHAVGDRVLEAVARLLSAGCEGRLVTRQGGEEFAVLFSNAAAAEALAVMEATRASVAGRRFRDRDSDQPIGTITFSAGLIEIDRDEPIEAALERADRLLYVAKANGRNTIVTG